MKIQFQSSLKKCIPACLALGILLTGHIPSLAQQDENNYDWLDSSPDGNWEGSGNRWQAPGGGYTGGPTSNRKLRFNNNHYTTTYNNRFSGFQIYQLIFDAGSNSNRTINGNNIVLNPESNNGNSVKIENYSSATHTINLAISRGSGSGDLQLNPVNGNLVFGSTIDNGGKTINIWGNNSKSIEFNNVIQGSGEFAIRQFSIVKFNAANTYTGSTVLYQGELWIMANGSISSSSSIWLGNGCCPTNVTKLFLADGDGGQNFSNQINFNYGDEGMQVLGGLNSSGTNTFSSNNISISTGKTLTIEEVSSSGTLEFSQGISGGGSIKLIGSGITVFTGANSYTGTTYINGGTLRLNRTGGTTLPVTNNITVSGGTLKISTDQELNDLSLASGQLIVDAGATLTISGNFTGGGTIVNNGTIVIKGTSAFPGSSSTISVMTNLEINRSSGVTLNKDLTITGTLNLVDGTLDVGTSTLTVSGTISGANSTKYIKTSSSGGLKRSVSSTSVNFPVGNSSYNPVTLTNNTGTADDFTIRVIDEIYTNGGSSGGTMPTLRVTRTWDIAKSNPSANAGNGVDMVFHWTPASQTSGTLAIPQLYHYESPSWVKKSTVSNTNYDVSAGTLTFTAYKGGFSPFSIMDDAITLPVTWLSFSGRALHNAVELSWTTAFEQNNSHFEVEESADGIRFTKIGSVNTTTNPQERNSYEYRVLKQYPNTQFYRVKQVDHDGKYSYSSIIKINDPRFQEIKSWMIVGTNQLMVQTTNTSTTAYLIQIHDASGRLVLSQQVSQGMNQFDLSRQGNGIFYIKIINGSTLLYTNTVIKQ